MEASARVSSKGQITIPRDVREALNLRRGDSVFFRVSGRSATIARNSNLLELAGSVEVPAAKQGTAWDEILRETRRKRAAARR